MNDENINTYRITNLIEKLIFNKNQVIRDEILLGEKKLRHNDKGDLANSDIIVSNMLKGFIIESTMLRKKEIVKYINQGATS
jgi:hypothetical protein